MKILTGFLTFLVIIMHVLSTHRQESYIIFDKFTLKDRFTFFLKQFNQRSCSIFEGPHCYQISNINELEHSNYFQRMMERLKLNEINVTVESMANLLMKELNKFQTKYQNSMKEVFKFSPKITLNLLLNFESFDETTLIKDTYMPEERIINFNIGFLKINFRGKLRLTQDRNGGGVKKNSNMHNTQEGPSKTYGVAEEKDLVIIIDKPVMIKSLYLRPHYPKFSEKGSDSNAYVIGYLNDKLVFKTQFLRGIGDDKEWTKIVPNPGIINILQIPKDFEVDDINISHDSEYLGEGEEEISLASVLQAVIDEYLSKNQIKEEDI